MTFDPVWSEEDGGVRIDWFQEVDEQFRGSRRETLDGGRREEIHMGHGKVS